MTFKVRSLQSLTRLVIILVSLRMTLFSEKMLISNRWISGLMSNLIKKSWKVSKRDPLFHTFWWPFDPSRLLNYRKLTGTIFKLGIFHWCFWASVHNKDKLWHLWPLKFPKNMFNFMFWLLWKLKRSFYYWKRKSDANLQWYNDFENGTKSLIYCLHFFPAFDSCPFERMLENRPTAKDPITYWIIMQ